MTLDNYTHNDTTVNSKMSTLEDGVTLEDVLNRLAKTDITDYTHPGEAKSNYEANNRQLLISAAKCALSKAKDRGYAFWEIFKATYQNRVTINAWTRDVLRNGYSTPTTPEALLDTLEGILQVTSPLSDNHFNRKFPVWAKHKTFNPIQTELEKLYDSATRVSKWDSENSRRVNETVPFTPFKGWDSLASTIFGVNDSLSQRMLEKWLVAAVARACNPGCQADNTLVLKGHQGIGKSTFFRVLGGSYFLDLDGSTDTLEVLRQLDRSWIVEMGELEGITRKKEVEELKAFLTKTKDTFRGLYEKTPQDHLRHVIFGATCNSDEILRDATGSRRFWVIDCGSQEVNTKYLKDNRDAILATAYHLYRTGFTYWADKDLTQQSEERNEQYREVNGFQDIVSNFIASLEDPYLEPLDNPNDGVAFLLPELMEVLLNIPVANQRANQNDKKVSQVLTELGYERRKLTVNGKRNTLWVKSTTKSPKFVGTSTLQQVKANHAYSQDKATISG
jgi:hypothetical protein